MHREHVNTTPTTGGVRFGESRPRGLSRLLGAAAGIVLAAGIGANAAAAQESVYGPIQDDVADILNGRGLDYEFDGPDLPVTILVVVEEEAAETAPLPAPPVTSSSAEPAEGSEGVPIEDPF